MSIVEAATLAVCAVILLAWYLSYTAARLHRLQTRVEGALAALDAQLVRRAEAAIELALSGHLDPASSLLVADAARACLDLASDGLDGGDWHDVGLAEREERESALTATMRGAVGPRTAGEGPGEPAAGPSSVRVGGGVDRESTDTGTALVAGPVDGAAGGAAELAERVYAAHDRVRLARAFYDDAVRDVRWQRQRPVVRSFRLAGHARLPRCVAFDDGPLDQVV